jgi:starch phosphorylase
VVSFDVADTRAAPRAAESLARLAYNLRWSWAAPMVSRLFEDLAPDVWRDSHNPVAVLRTLDQGAIAAHADAICLAERELEAYLAAPGSDLSRVCPPVCYLSAEFGITRCLPLYAGGLGVLAGDHLKAASDRRLPVVGMGLLYRYGYFRQSLDASGYQIERFDGIEPDALPLRPVVVGDSVQLRVSVPLGDANVAARIWKADVGNVPLYLMDTNVAENQQDERWITGHLYGGTEDTRIRQEIVLGIGAARVSRALQLFGLEDAPRVYHLNEGHSAFLVLELVREALHDGIAGSVEEALARVAQRVVFTTHTPVSAGHDVFHPDLIERYLWRLRLELGLSRAEMLQLGQLHPSDNAPFSMTVLALRGAAQRNAVSQLHERVTNAMWSSVGVDSAAHSAATSIIGITNGVHAPSWVGHHTGMVFDAYLGPHWRTAARDPLSWSGIAGVPPRVLWSARTAQRMRLLERVRLELGKQAPAIRVTADALPGDCLVIGFARRFTTYKRPGLLLEEPQRLADLVGNPRRPVLFVFAGKAHPRDEPGKLLIQRVVNASFDQRFAGRLVFIQDYDVELASLMVQGCDVWLNTPRRPFEASGTSGMKAMLNGALHMSELDGWWHEAYRPEVGWALGVGIPEDLPEPARDAAEARQLMDLLEWHVAPMFFDRDSFGVPLDWLAMVQRSITQLAPAFSADRMVTEYVHRMYVPAASSQGSGDLPSSPA